MLTRSGHEALTLRSVAREASVTAPAIYRHFEDRDALVGQLVIGIWEELAAVMAAADEREESAGPLAQLQAQLAAYIDFASANPTRYELLFAMSPDPEMVQSLPDHSATSSVYRILELAVTRCKNSGYTLPLPFQAEPTDPNTVLLFVVAHGRIALAKASQHEDFSTREASHEFVRDVVRSLVRPPAS